MSRGRILHVIDGLGMGGAEQLLPRYLPKLAEQGFDPGVIVLQGRDSLRMRPALAQARVPVQLVEVSRLRHATQIAAFLRTVGHLKPDLIHTHLEFASLLGALAGRIFGRPVVSTLHTLDAPGLSSRGDMRRWLMYRALSNWTDRVICLTQGNADIARASGLGRAPVVILPNGVATTPYDGPVDVLGLRASLGIPQDAPLAITVCVLRPEKGVDVLIDAFPQALAAVPGAHLLIVGDGPERDRLTALARASSVADRIHFAGYRTDVAHLLRIADLFVLATLFDAQPTVIMEAMAARLPVVASDFAGVPDMVTAGETGLLVPPGDPAALAEAMVPFLRDRALARAYGAAGRQRLEEDFSLDRQIGKLGLLYDELIGQNGGSSCGS
ncbi:MAG: glycosyltransferase [Paracoccaceae bacterium]|nr:glycosyltransferase [Paracoccaceae bacterium]